MVARILQESGEFKRRPPDFYDCKRCVKNPKLRAARGCGVAPTVKPRGKPSRPWDVDEWIRECEEQGTKPSARNADYRFVDVGGVIATLGPAWGFDCCARFYDPSKPKGISPPLNPMAVAEADRILEIETYVQLGCVQLVQEGPLTPRNRQLLSVARAMRSKLKVDAHKRDADEAKKNAPKSASARTRRRRGSYG